MSKKTKKAQVVSTPNDVTPAVAAELGELIEQAIGLAAEIAPLKKLEREREKVTGALKTRLGELGIDKFVIDGLGWATRTVRNNEKNPKCDWEWAQANLNHNTVRRLKIISEWPTVLVTKEK